MQNFVRGNKQRRILLVFFLDIYIYFTSLDVPDAVNKRVYFPVLKVLLRCNTWKRVGFLREIYISRFRAKSRGWSKYLKSIYICLSEFKGFLKFGFETDKYRFYFFFFFLKAWEQYRFQWKIWCSNSNMQKYSRDTGFVLKKKWISSLHLYRIIHELDKRCSNYYWVTKEENFFNFYHHQLLNHIYIY